MSFVEKLITPAWYKTQGNAMVGNMAAYYRPLFRSGSITPLWHGMFAVGLVMYTASQIGHKQKAIQSQRKIQKEALTEYYAKHGNPNAH